MRVPFLAYVFIQALFALVAIVGLAIIAARRREPIAVARIDRPGRRFVARIAPVFSTLVALAGMWQLHTHATDVVVVQPDLRVARAVYLGSPDDYARLPRSVQLAREVPSGPTWIVNDSHQAIIVSAVYYGPEKPHLLRPGELGVMAPSAAV